jgi:hypothetical protein
MTVTAYRGIGHPWTAASGWDQMVLSGEDHAVTDAMIADAEAKFWKLWYRDIATNTAHMFKPSGASAEWSDISWAGTPRGHGHEFNIGDEVYTDYTGKITHHKVTDITPRNISQTTIMLRVYPAPRGSTYVSEDRGALKPGKPVGMPWFDSAWFRKVP